jgi:hypothetical protein
MSVKRTTVIFDQGGKEHTDETLRIALNGAIERGIDTVLISTSTGYTGERAVEIFEESGLKLVFVTHQTGYRTPGLQTLPPEKRAMLQQYGAVLTCTDVLTGGVDVGMARQRPEKTESQQFSLPFILPPPNVLVANTLRLFAQGVKVCAEIAMMACDSNIIPSGKPVVVVAGSSQGADTAMVVVTAESNRMRELKMQEILAKPA